MDTELKQHPECAESRAMARFEKRMDAFDHNLEEAIRQSYTAMGDRLVAEFRKVAGTAEMRTRQALVNVVEFNERLMAIEDRVSSLERKSA